MKRYLQNLTFAAFVACLMCLSTQVKADIAVSDLTDGTKFKADWADYTSGLGSVQFKVLAISPNAFSTNNGGLMRYVNGKVIDSNVRVSEFYSMCVDLSQRVGRPSDFIVGDPALAPTPITTPPGGTGMGTRAADALGWLWHSTQEYGDALAYTGKSLFERVIQQKLDNTSTKNLVAGALQLATWKLVYDGKTDDWVDLTKGNLQITSVNGPNGIAEYNLAQMFLTEIEKVRNGIDGWGAGVTALLSAREQDQLILNAQGAPRIPTPEPATIMIWSLVGSLGAVCGVRFKRRRLISTTHQEILA